MSMWFEVTQNNPGGKFIVNKNICYNLFIEANSLLEAKIKAETLGCYWDGVEIGYDCPCCGDRWDRPIDAITFPRFHGSNNIEEYAQNLADKYGGWTTPDARIFYLDGTIKEINSKKKNSR